MSEWSGVMAQLRRTETRRGRASLGMFRIEGTRLHERALRAGAALERVVVGRAWAAAAGARERSLLDGFSRAHVPCVHAPDDALLELACGRETGTLAGLVRIPADPSPGAIAAEVENALLLVAVDVEDPGNVGALVRTAHASGADGLVAVGLSEPYHPQAVRTSMGSVFRLPLCIRPDVAAAIAELTAAGVETWAAVSRDGQPLQEVASARRPGPLAIVVGSEAFGLSHAVLDGVDRAVSAPMPDEVDSLSVNAAAAVFLWEVRRSGLAS